MVTLSFFILCVSALESSTNLKLELKSWIFACCNISLKLKMFLSYRKTALALLILALMLASVPLIKDSTSSSELWAFLVQHWFHSLSSSWSWSLIDVEAYLWRDVCRHCRSFLASVASCETVVPASSIVSSGLHFLFAEGMFQECWYLTALVHFTVCSIPLCLSSLHKILILAIIHYTLQAVSEAVHCLAKKSIQ